MVLLITDGNLQKRPPKGVEEIVVKDARMRSCFAAAVSECVNRDVGAFYQIDADNLHESKEVSALLDHVMSDADVSFSGFAITDKRYDEVVFPPTHDYVLGFSLYRHTWPNTAAFRTSCFLDGPLCNDPREFVRLTLKAAAENGMEPVAMYDRDVGFFYFQHGQSLLDRSFNK